MKKTLVMSLLAASIGAVTACGPGPGATPSMQELKDLWGDEFACLSLDRYAIYDVDRDGNPEVFLGSTEDHTFIVYSYIDGEFTYLASAASSEEQLSVPEPGCIQYMRMSGGSEMFGDEILFDSYAEIDIHLVSSKANTVLSIEQSRNDKQPQDVKDVEELYDTTCILEVGDEDAKELKLGECAKYRPRTQDDLIPWEEFSL